MSDSDMLKAAEAEVARLEKELEATPAYQKLQLAKKVVNLYRATPDARYVGEHAANFGRPKPSPSAEVKINNPVPPKRLWLASTKTQRIESAAIKYLAAKAARAPASELLNAITAAGIEITGAEPAKALSAYLSNSKALNNVREYGGYGLAEWGISKGPDLLTKSGA
ncbi:hypothetical protein [Bradyrhizobium sp. LVM 105]|uniref:hypothetical protein n=1 Tax=Bradyrhizobium sp. LVM 105 TaxID=2341115 RepID=UPI000F812317|nr:hypothetical protein [Bradyrhizobium sp. LVM 105]